MTPPTGQVAGELFDAVRPLAYDDANRGDATAILTEAFGLLLEDVASVANPDPNVRVGWSQAVDLDDAPAAYVPWLGQFVGVRIPPNLSDANARQRVRSADGFNRGTRASIITAAQATLTGNRTVVLRERYDLAAPGPDEAYHLTVFTFTPETPDPAVTLAAILTQKPAGIVLHYEDRDGRDWQSIHDDGYTWTTLSAAFPTWADVSGTY